MGIFTYARKDNFFIDTNKKIMNSDYHRFKNKAVEIELRDKIGYLVKNYDVNELIKRLILKIYIIIFLIQN